MMYQSINITFAPVLITYDILFQIVREGVPYCTIVFTTRVLVASVESLCGTSLLRYVN